MIKVSRSLPDIAVLRGGKKDFRQSLSDGAEVLSSLSKIGYQPLDVLIDKSGEWTVHGKPTDAHHIFSRTHTVIDTTHTRGEDYQKLAKRMGVPLLFSRDNEMVIDREDIYRILRQQGIRTPDTAVIRAKQPLQDNTLRDIWSKYHTPLMVRPIVRTEDESSKLIKNFSDLENTVNDYRARGIDIHLLTYRKVPTSSVAILPNFRDERLYMPVWVETFSSIGSIPSGESPMRAYMHAPDWRINQVKEFASKVYDALGLSTHACIDIIHQNDNYVVVNVEAFPSLRKDGRFAQSLATTGADIGQYVHSIITNRL